MKITMTQPALLHAIARAQSVVERRNTIPILANVLIEADGDEASFLATDLDIEVRENSSATVEESGATTVNAVTLHDIVKKLPGDADMELTDDEKSGRLHVAAGRSAFQLVTLPKGDFPVMKSSEFAVKFTADAAALHRLFDKTKFAISTEETRYYLNGVYMHVAESDTGPVLRCVSTDGHRLALVDAPPPEGAAEMAGVIVPRKTVGELLRILNGRDEEIEVSVSENKIKFATSSLTMTSKVIDGTFPDYARVIPERNPKRLEIDAGDLAEAVDRVAAVSAERSRAVKLALTSDALNLTVNAADSGDANEQLAAAYGDEPLDIAFNARYLLEIAAQIDRDNAVFLFNDKTDPTVIRDGDDTGALYVLMPMRA